MNKYINKLLLTLTAILSIGVANAATSITSDDAGFLELQNGKKWTRINISNPATDSDFAFFNIRLDCNTETHSIFIDEIGITTIARSDIFPDSDIKSISSTGIFTSPSDDWEKWLGTTSLKLNADGNLYESAYPLHQIDLIGQKKFGAPILVTSIRLNPGPSRPREVTAYNGNSNGLAAKVESIAMNAIGSKSRDFPKNLNATFMTQSGVSYVMSFDLSNIKKDVAVAIHQYCGNP